jgi:hypothetical protein
MGGCPRSLLAQGYGNGDLRGLLEQQGHGCPPAKKKGTAAMCPDSHRHAQLSGPSLEVPKGESRLAPPRAHLFAWDLPWSVRAGGHDRGQRESPRSGKTVASGTPA